MSQKGLGLIEILIVLVIVGVVTGLVLRQYMSSTIETVERFQQDKPLSFGKVAADQATLSTIRTQLDLYRAQHERFPADKAAVLALLAGPPRFQCPGNDFEYDPATGRISLLIQDPGRC
jgi:prepilin-type N-terminal cleavage/methylation domain-containing protein